MKNKSYRIPTITPLVEDSDLEESLLSLYDKDNPDINLFNMLDAENIRLAGSKIKVYKFLRDSNYDDVYMEERNKVISKKPIVLWGHYTPEVLEEALSQFGIELQDDQLFSFNLSYSEAKLGRRLIPGDILEPEFQNRKYEVFEVQEEAFDIYGVYHLICHSKLLRDSADVVDEPETELEQIPSMDGYAGEEDDIWSM
tara:strand:+ start:1078 stop:1671 length:594 start_codon:yes stop_codon:yes gene_type:complete